MRHQKAAKPKGETIVNRNTLNRMLTKSVATAFAVSTVFVIGASACAPTKSGSTASSISSPQAQALLAKLHAQNKSVKPDLIALPQGEPSIAGMWVGSDLMDGQPVDVYFEQFSGDGLEILNDMSPILEGNICYGTYAKTAPYTYTVNHPTFLYDDAGVNVVAIGYIRETIVLDKTGQSFTGHVQFSSFDLAGNPLGTPFDGDFQATRLGINSSVPPLAFAPKSKSSGNRLSAWMRTPAAGSSN